MQIPASPHFTSLSLAHVFNADRLRLDGGLAPRRGADPDWSSAAYDDRSYLGIPFALGGAGEPNVILLEPGAPEIRIDLGPIPATYVVFLHAVEDRTFTLPAGFGVIGPAPGGQSYAGNTLGQHVSDYRLGFDDGAEASTPILRRFAIQQRHIDWGASPFESVPANSPSVFTTATEDFMLGRVARMNYGDGETRHEAGRTEAGENLWLYALENPTPDRPIRAIVLKPAEERSVIYGISTTMLTDHPLRPGVRRKLRLDLPAGVSLNALGELDVDDRNATIKIDLGAVISARAALDYDQTRWRGREPDVQPTPSNQAVVVEYAAHPKGRLYVATGADAHLAADLPAVAGSPSSDPGALRLTPIGSAERPVQLRFIDKETRQPVAVRLHIHGEAGEYLPPRGRHRKVNAGWFEDNYGEFVNDLNQYSYIQGDCVVDLPLANVFVEITRGCEFVSIRTALEIAAETETVTFELERRLSWRARGWVTADTHVHFLSPQTALLEGAAEGVNVVNLLASQWGEMFSNVSDFDGRTTFGARDFGGDGEFLVRVGTENRMQVLGHISLLGYSGSMIHPLCTGGPSESAIGDPIEVSMAEWATRCIDQGGLVVLPHAPNPQCERAADIVLDRVDAIEMMTFNPHHAQINPYGLADWYRYLNIGHQVPLAGGSDKMSAASLLGGVRTYTHLGGQEFTYGNWMDAIRAGNTFVTVGPLIEFTVNGKPAGSRINLPASGGTVDVTWTAESVRAPIDQIEVIAGGLVAEQINTNGTFATSGNASVRVTSSTWLAIRVRGSLRARAGDIAAHTSAVQVLVGDAPIFSRPDAASVLEQIEGAIAYVDTVAPRPEAQRFNALRATLEAAHNRLHNRLHQLAIDHSHTVVRDHDAHHEE